MSGRRIKPWDKSSIKGQTGGPHTGLWKRHETSRRQVERNDCLQNATWITTSLRASAATPTRAAVKRPHDSKTMTPRQPGQPQNSDVMTLSMVSDKRKVISSPHW